MPLRERANLRWKVDIAVWGDLALRKKKQRALTTIRLMRQRFCKQAELGKLTVSDDAVETTERSPCKQKLHKNEQTLREKRILLLFIALIKLEQLMPLLSPYKEV